MLCLLTVAAVAAAAPLVLAGILESKQQATATALAARQIQHTMLLCSSLQGMSML